MFGAVSYPLPCVWSAVRVGVLEVLDNFGKCQLELRPIPYKPPFVLIKNINTKEIYTPLPSITVSCRPTPIVYCHIASEAIIDLAEYSRFGFNYQFALKQFRKYWETRKTCYAVHIISGRE